MKGDRKRKKSMFKTGQVSKSKGQTRERESENANSGYIRLQRDEFELMTEETRDGRMIIVKDVDGQPCNVKLLRPKPAPRTYFERLCEPGQKRNAMKSYRIIQPEKMEILWQTTFKEHAALHPTCTGTLMLDEDGEVQVGICWKERTKCTQCGYVSQRHKMYDEVNRGRRGRRSTAPNLALQVGLTHTPMANTGLQTLFHAANIPAPSTSSLQTLANDVNDTIIQVNKTDMTARRLKLKEMNIKKGLPENTPIRVEGDGRYNNPLYSAAGKTPFQPASHVVYTVCENESRKKNKLWLY